MMLMQQDYLFLEVLNSFALRALQKTLVYIMKE